MALFLAVFGVWCLWIAITGNVALPKRRRTGERDFSADRALYKASPKLWSASNRLFLAVCGLGLLFGALYCLKLALTP